MQIRLLSILIFFFITFQTVARVYRTGILHPNIRTLIVGVQGEKFGLPVIELGSDQQIEVRFDEMSHESNNFAYTIIHCNADWTASDIHGAEFLSGFTTNYITDFERSVNTHHLYTHYKFSIPNQEMGLKISGNYVIIIYADDRRDQPVAHVCFSVVEPRVTVQAQIRSNTDIEINRRFQQLDFDLNFRGYQVRDPMTEIKTLVRQNNRTDNEVFNPKPSFVSGTTLSFVNNRALIFEGGYEYHSFDISSELAPGRGVNRIRFVNGSYEATLNTDRIRRGAYEHQFDVNGRFLINQQNAFTNVHTESDYMWVHFNLETNQPFFDGQLFLGGEFNFNQLTENVRMNWNNAAKAYHQSVLLKQGGYNYQYWFLAKGKKTATVERVDGSHWQTGNEYTIYVYHRPWGERYDKLIAVFTKSSEQ